MAAFIGPRGRLTDM